MNRLLFIAAFCFVTIFANAQEITVAAAADLSSVFPQVAARFEQETGKKVHLNFGASGNFYLQIENGAPFDLFFSADLRYVQRLNDEGLLEPGSMYNYAVGKLVLFVPNGSSVNPTQGLRVLLSPQVRKIAIANPQHAPYGRAAIDALKRAGLYDAVRSKLVEGENISQAAQFVQSGSVDAGILALSLARSPKMSSSGRFAELPPGSYTPLVQAAGIMKSSRQKATAAEFLAFLRRPEIARLLAHYGFALPVAHYEITK
jgi:molybdate transport system substrate-binding protein